MLKLGIDIDGVCCDSIGYLERKVNRELGHSLSDKSPLIRKFLSIPDPNYIKLPWIPNAFEALSELSQFCDIEFITARCESQREYTEQWLSALPFEIKLTMTSYASKLKEAYMKDIFIDDRLDYLLELKDYCCCIWFTPDIIQGLPAGVYLIHNWTEILDLIKSL